MVQVIELVALMKRVKINGVAVAMNFLFCRTHPCKERAHPGYDFKGQTNFTHKRSEVLSRDEVVRCAGDLFAPRSPYSFPGQQKAYSYINPPPVVRMRLIFRNSH